MSGHSKWSTIKRKKGALDQKRGNLFTKLARGITVAVKKGSGGDVETNFALRLAVDKAKASNMPKDNIQRAIDRGLGKGEEGDLEEFTLEGYGPRGVAVIVEAVSDNRNRTVAELKSMFDKAGGSLAEPGSVMYQFERKGYVSFESELSDDLFLESVDQGAEDVESDDDFHTIVCPPEKVQQVAQVFRDKGIEDVDAGVMYKAKMLSSVGFDQVEGFLEKLEGHDDVQEVYTNVAS